jgi:ATP-dependent Clp protease ATP-binding subunit ClpC
MFDRFTLRADQVHFYARSEVSQLGGSTIEHEHILLGLLDEGKGLGSRILLQTGVSLDDVRSEIVGRLPGGEKVPESTGIPFSASCERALQ